jgi:hypothetical protein
VLNEASDCEGRALDSSHDTLFHERFADVRAMLLLARLNLVQHHKPAVFNAAMAAMQSARQLADSNSDHDTSAVLLSAMHLADETSACGGSGPLSLAALLGYTDAGYAQVSALARQIVADSMAGSLAIFFPPALHTHAAPGRRLDSWTCNVSTANLLDSLLHEPLQLDGPDEWREPRQNAQPKNLSGVSGQTS